MAKNPFSKFGKKVESIVLKAFDPASIDKIGRDTAKQIKTRTMLGQGVDPNSKANVPLKPLQNSTKENRTRYRKNLSGKTTPRTSNLTATGTMLSNITHRTKRNTIEIFFKKAAAKKLSNKRSSGISVSRLANIHQKEGAGKKKVKRPFFDLARFERAMLERQFRSVLRQKLRQKLS